MEFDNIFRAVRGKVNDSYNNTLADNNGGNLLASQFVPGIKVDSLSTAVHCRRCFRPY